MDRPCFEVELPSLGTPYAGKIPAKLTIHPIRAKEEKLLSGAGGAAERISSINLVLKSCTKEPIDPKDLITSDRFFLLLYLRIHSYGEWYDVQLNCDGCGQKFPHKVNLNELEVKKLPEDFVEPIPVKLPVSGETVGLRLLRGEDEETIARHVARAVAKGEPGDPAFLIRLQKQVMTVDGVTLSDRDKAQWVENLLVRDTEAIRKKMEGVESGVVAIVEVACPRCDNAIRTAMPFQASFFRSSD